MDELIKKHRQQQRDLQSRVTQKKKSATKKTRKGVNAECEELERQLQEQQALEVAQLGNQENATNEEENGSTFPTSDEDKPTSLVSDDVDSIEQGVEAISLTIPNGSNGQVKKPNRQKARLARRAAEQQAAVDEAAKEADDLPNLREVEIKSMREAYSAKGLIEHDIRSDGHCMYAAVADQLNHEGLGRKPAAIMNVDDMEKADYRCMRRVAAAFIEQNPEDFLPYLESPLDDHIKEVRDTGEWGGHLEILALARAYNLNICVLHGDGHVDTIGDGATQERQSLWLAYYRHRYGLGEHYNSLRQK